jgi:hypothetical protein
VTFWVPPDVLPTALLPDFATGFAADFAPGFPSDLAFCFAAGLAFAPDLAALSARSAALPAPFPAPLPSALPAFAVSSSSRSWCDFAAAPGFSSWPFASDDPLPPPVAAAGETPSHGTSASVTRTAPSRRSTLM